MRALSALLLVAGCGSCDGKSQKPPELPKQPVGVTDGGVVETDGGGAVEVPEPQTGYLVAPKGTLEMLFKGLAAAEKSDTTSGRVLLLFFGDSHTAGDSLTSRLRVTWQTKFGDAGRGLVAAGRPTARHYYQRDVKYG